MRRNGLIRDRTVLHDRPDDQVTPILQLPEQCIQPLYGENSSKWSLLSRVGSRGHISLCDSTNIRACRDVILHAWNALLNRAPSPRGKGHLVPGTSSPRDSPRRAHTRYLTPPPRPRRHHCRLREAGAGANRQSARGQPAPGAARHPLNYSPTPLHSCSTCSTPRFAP